jgi:hypothetical protein
VAGVLASNIIKSDCYAAYYAHKRFPARVNLSAGFLEF